MSANEWEIVSDYLIPLGAFLGYIALVLELVLHYADLKRYFMKPNFQFEVYAKGNYPSIAVTNRKTGDPLRDWRICQATDCEGYLAIKNHDTKDDSNLDVKETTPLRWEGEGKILKKMPPSILPSYLQAFVLNSQDRSLGVRFYDEDDPSAFSWVKQLPKTVDVIVRIGSNEGTAERWMRGVDLIECIKTGQFPPFTDDC